MSCAAHKLTPDLGICGFDIAVTAEGPVVVECNDRPNHMLYQFAAQTGSKNPEFAPVFKQVIKRKRAA